jgi:chloride channel, nucleotide-sensitive, 1A
MGVVQVRPPSPQHIADRSRNVILFSTSTSRGLSISYPAIGLHALGSSPSAALSPEESTQVVFLQLNLHDAETINSDDDLEILDITLAPLTAAPPAPPPSPAEAPPAAKALFEALSACADLHPDPQTPGGSDGGGGAAPGDGGWITAENMDRFVDAEGNFAGGMLGPGAGHVHGREDGGGDEDDDDDDDDDDGGEGGVNGDGAGDDDAKWQRTG